MDLLTKKQHTLLLLKIPRIPILFFKFLAPIVPPFNVDVFRFKLCCELWDDSESIFERSSKGISLGGLNPDWYLKINVGEFAFFIYFLTLKGDIWHSFKLSILTYFSMTLSESSFSLTDSEALTIPSKHFAIIVATDDSTSAADLMNSLTPLVRFSSISCNLLNTFWQKIIMAYHTIFYTSFF